MAKPRSGQLGTGTGAPTRAPALVDNFNTFLALRHDLLFTCPCSRFIALVNIWILLLFAGRRAGVHHAAVNVSCVEPPRAQLCCGDADYFFSLEIRSIFS